MDFALGNENTVKLLPQPCVATGPVVGRQSQPGGLSLRAKAEPACVPSWLTGSHTVTMAKGTNTALAFRYKLNTTVDDAKHLSTHQPRSQSVIWSFVTLDHSRSATVPIAVASSWTCDDSSAKLDVRFAVSPSNP